MNYNTYIIILLLIIILPIIASIGININYKKFSRTSNKKNLTGFDVARKILDNHGLNDMMIVETKGNLTDHYDPSRKVIRLSHDIFHGTSIASIAVAAHECGHAIQDKDKYLLMRIRSAIVPTVSFISNTSYYIMVFGFIMRITNLVYLGIISLGATLIFQLITLPVEINASKRALKEIDELSLVDDNEHNGAKKMLTAAAFTYVASVITTILEMLRLLLIMKDNNDN